MRGRGKGERSRDQRTRSVDQHTRLGQKRETNQPRTNPYQTVCVTNWVDHTVIELTSDVARFSALVSIQISC